MNLIDSAVPVRDGDELDLRRVESFLKENVPDQAGNLQLEQFPSGYSNLTYLVRSGERELVLRRPPRGKKAKTAHDMLREYRILKALKPVFPYAPTPLAYCDDLSIIGSPFYVMERIKGLILRKDLPEGLQLRAADASRLCENLIGVLCELHGLDYRAVGLEGFGKPQGYVRRQVEGWSSRYRDARTKDAPDCEAVMRWLHDHMPADSEQPAVIHNDFKFDNVVLNPQNPLQIIGVLDWEMATIGDPLMDLGGSLGYWIDRDDPQNMQLIRTLPTTAEGMLTRRELVDLYLKRTGRRIASFDFYLCFGYFRLAVIAQQIYYRYYHGQARDERFKMLIVFVRILEEAALRVMKESVK